jgi:hypothetical protein
MYVKAVVMTDGFIFASNCCVYHLHIIISKNQVEQCLYKNSDAISISHIP